MIVVSLVLSVVAVVVAGWSLFFTSQADRRARQPDLAIELEDHAGFDGTTAIYVVRNEGPEDLTSVVVHRPVTRNSVRYNLARVGTDYREDGDAHLGPIRLGEDERFVLKIGPGTEVPDLRVRIECNAGHTWWSLSRGKWTLTKTLEFPRLGYVG